jgi:opacity protein-like surface antigen
MAIVASAASTPALARDGVGYVGIDGGLMKVEDLQFDFEDDDSSVDDLFSVDVKTGFDVALVGGHDFGLIRVEGEVGYKRASLDKVRVDQSVIPASELDADGRARVLSGMVNLLLDFGDDNGLSGFVGGGAGIARVKVRGDLSGTGTGGIGLSDLGFSGSDRGLAWQGIAGVRAAVTDNIDLGLKYRFFNTKFELEGAGGELSDRFRSHSLLASLTYTFAAPPAPPLAPAPPPPPPPAPATQTCPDGSVILATDACLVPPPPPPPPAPERG